VKSWRHALLGVGALALAVRCLYLWQISSAPFFDLRLGDAEAYHLWAQRIAAGDWLGSGVFYQAPLYPYFLAVIYRLFGDSTATVRIVQAVLGAASCTLLSFAGWRMFGRRGLLAGAILAIYPAAIFLDGSIDKTALSTTLLCGLLALLAAKRWLGSGIVLGLLVLTRENALLLAIPALFVAPRPQRLRFAAGVLAVLLMVGLRNLAAGGEFHITTAQSGPNLYIGNHVGALGWYQALVTGHGSAADERDDATRLAEQARGRHLTPGEVSNYWTGRAFEFVRSRPLEWLGLMARKIALTVNNAEIADTESQSVYAEWSWLLRLPLGFGLLLGVASLNWRGDRTLWTMAAVYALGVAAFYVLARYRFPLVPLLLLLAVSVPRRPSRAAIAAAVAAFAIAFLPLVDPRLGRATNYYAIATALSRDQGRLDDAAAFYRRALDVDPRFAGAEFGLATVLTKQGRANEAIPHFEAALAIWPDHQEAHYNFGYALAASGRTEEAIAQFTAALRLRPDDAAAHGALAQLLLRLDRDEEAIPHLTREIELNPSDAAAHANLGAILANRGHITEALPHFERAAALDPTDDRYRRNLEEARRLH
jgi:tetratricopeptide (TPR) repeat protein